MKTLKDGWRRTVVAMATVAACGGAVAQEIPSTLGTLLLDPQFEDQFFDTVSRVVEAARANPNGAPPDLSLKNLRQDPDFDAALNQRIADVVDEAIDARQNLDVTTDNGAPAFGEALVSLAPTTSHVEPIAPAVEFGLFTSADACPSTYTIPRLPLWVNATSYQDAQAAETAATNKAERAAAAHIKVLNGDPARFCPAKCKQASFSDGPTPHTTDGSQSWFDVFLGAADWASNWTGDAQDRRYHASASWWVTGRVDCTNVSAVAPTTAKPAVGRSVLSPLSVR
ncbi:MAG: hypothetical protein K0U93_04565 [Gammaproteobacteria bacterium]|nr:hypothetical protein [Gammaproteobacteria bacterium]